MQDLKFLRLNSAALTEAGTFYELIAQWLRSDRSEGLRDSCLAAADRYKRALDATIDYVASLKDSPQKESTLLAGEQHRKALASQLQFLDH